MANIPLKSIKFPGLSDTYTIPQIDNTLMREGQAADAKETGNKIEGIKTNVNSAETGTLYDYIEDVVVLDSTGYPTGYTGALSYSGKTNSAEDMPFYKARPVYNAWYPTADLNGVFRYMNMIPPAAVSGKKYQIGFWVDSASLSLSPNVCFRFGILPSRNNFAVFNGLPNIGYTQTVGTAILVVDAIVGTWFHVLVTVDDSAGTNNTTNILLGSDHCRTTDRIKFSPPVLTLGDKQQWFINYKNPTYNPDSIINDEIVSSEKTWSSSKISNIISSKLSGKKVNWIGDSIFYGGGDDGNNGWIGRIADKYGVTFETLAVNGAMIIDPQTTGYTSISARCTNFVETDPDYVIFDGGTNDGFNRTLSPLGEFDPARFDTQTDKTTSFSTAFEYVIYTLKQTYPNAKIGYIAPYLQISYNQNIDVYDRTGRIYFDRAIELCEKWGVPYLDLRKKSNLNYQIPAMQKYYKDIVHINGDGYDYTVDIVYEWLKTL